MKKRFVKKHSLIGWLVSISLALLGIFVLAMAVFAKISLDNLMEQEIENQKSVLRLNVENIDGTLSSLENYLLQTFSNSEEVVRIETTLDGTLLSMAKQSLVRSFKRIISWNDSLEFLFCYSPDSMEKTLVRVSSGNGRLAEWTVLEESVREYIDGSLAKNRYPGDGYLLVNAVDRGYVIRIYKIRNSYFGMCVDAETVLEPLEELDSTQDCTAFLCGTDGTVFYPKESSLEGIRVEDNGNVIILDGEEYLQLNYLSGEGDFYVGTLTRAEAVTRQFHDMRRLIAYSVAGGLLFLVGMSILLYHTLYRPIRSMETGMKRVGSGEWNLIVKEDSRIAEYDSMIRNFNEMVSEIGKLKIQKYEKELEASKVYLQYLQLQVNPHFYLNALNIIYSMAEVRNFELVQEMTMSLVEYSRYMFREPDSMVTISQEMEHVDNYMKIQQLRFPNRIDYQVFISSEIEEAMIPPFVIQSFVENSIKYAVSFEQHNVLSIRGRIQEIEKELFVRIEIRDNGTGYSQEVLEMMEEGAPTDGVRQVGIRNVKARLALVFGEAAKVILKNEDGAVTILLIPLTWQEG